MKLTTQQFQQDFSEMFRFLYPVPIEKGTPSQWFEALGKLIGSYNNENWQATNEKYANQKQVYYFSMEFLPGRFLTNHLYNMGIMDTVQAGLKDLEIPFEDIVNSEPEPGLGNGGLGRLAACFMDSGASLGVPLHGNGLRYEFGLFKQKFINNYQIEMPDNWLEQDSPWDYRNEQEAVTVRFGGHVWLNQMDGNYEAVYENTTDILAVPYDMQMIGSDNDIVNTLRLWQAEVAPENEENFPSIEDRNEVHQLTGSLYPDDSTEEGRILRVRQEYFLVSAGVQSIINHFVARGLPIESLADYYGFHINDTHPAMVVPELMRILMDDFDLEWDKAQKITVSACSYTNHTVLYEALEKWPVDMIRRLLPRIYQIIEEMHNRSYQRVSREFSPELAEKTAILKDGEFHMASIAVFGSHSVNGVASLHTQILKEDVLNHFYQIFPDRFINQTNGVTHRRWVHAANPDLTKLISDRIGDSWKKTPNDLVKLKAFADDEETLKALAEVKKIDKEALSKYIEEETGIKVSTDALFDTLIKRLHAYKRQDMQLLHMIARYLEIKDNPSVDMQPRVFIFGAKAAPSYTYAKQLIKVINEFADLVNNDPDVGDKMKIIFLENYRVSVAEKIIPATDLSEHISLAGKEASGTGNMKFMSNGALLMGTRDGANVEIIEQVGEEHAFIFGMDVDEVKKVQAENSYHSVQFYENNPFIKRILDTLIDGTIPNIKSEGQGVYNALVNYGDEYFAMLDLESFIEAQKRADALYANKKEWYKKALLNIATSGPFSSDYTVGRYVDQIWGLKRN